MRGEIVERLEMSNEWELVDLKSDFKPYITGEKFTYHDCYFCQYMKDTKLKKKIKRQKGEDLKRFTRKAIGIIWNELEKNENREIERDKLIYHFEII